ncbi:MAG: 2-dehydro-3-deoxyphosphooctonate aldolase [Ignavibacteriaceae bacterium]|nr:2-dehydro-3-deoxyphosphooctonate aldolase [Ignavibacteriaceae bacterium]
MTDISEITKRNSFFLLAGPCVVESRELLFTVAEAACDITGRLGIPYIFKASYKKANRTSLEAFTGIGDLEALEYLKEVREKFKVPVVTDVHSPEEAALAAAYADVLQIPAFLCRQTDLLIAAGKTGRAVNIKKGQFLAPWDMKFAAEKTASTGNRNIWLTERGTTFGYGNLVVDMRSFIMMRKLGYPVIMDATHSVQLPGAGGKTSGEPEYIKPLARAAMAAGIDGLFLEVHPEPKKAMSDADSQLDLKLLEELLVQLKEIDMVIRKYR